MALNGCSLTVAEVGSKDFKVCLIPETQSFTTFGEIQLGDAVNIEIDTSTQVIVDTLKSLLKDEAFVSSLKQGIGL